MTQAKGLIRVLLADDQKLVREGWCALLDHGADISVVGQARDGQEAVELALQLQPDIILMDVKKPRLDGLQATRQIIEQRHNAKVLIVTQSLDEILVLAAIQQGAFGYLSKNDVFDELRPAVLALHAGQRYFSKTVRDQVAHLLDAPEPVTMPGQYNWRAPAWAFLHEELERTIADTHASREWARSIRVHCQAMRAHVQQTRALSQQLLQPDSDTCSAT